MFYTCGRRCNKLETFQKAPGCKGPYLHDDSKIFSPTEILFNENEIPVGYNFPNKL